MGGNLGQTLAVIVFVAVGADTILRFLVDAFKSAMKGS